MPSATVDLICQKYNGKRIGDYDIALVPDFLNKLGKTPSLLSELVEAYPIRGAGDRIIEDTVQWVGGDNAALKYRGNVLKREKIWLQRGPVSEGYAYYYYTGVQYEVVPAQTDWARCPEFCSIVDEYDGFCKEVCAQQTNQAIITRYRDGDHFIGAHYDKPKSIAKSRADAASLITVIKIGEVGRRFNITDLQENIIWSEIIKPGDALVMTLEANLQTKHEVPVCAEGEQAGDSGSIVFRSITSVLSYDKVQQKIKASRKQKAAAKVKKEADKKRKRVDGEAHRAGEE